MTQITSRKAASPEVRFKTKSWTDGLLFAIATWLFSRLVIVVSMQFIAPLRQDPPVNFDFPLLGFAPNFVPKMGWELFSHWDGAWYREIATNGYHYVNDGQQYSVAFFPLFPLLTRGVMTLGLPFNVAGTLVNNFAFLGALLLLYRWAEEHHGTGAARWATAVMAWCPFSLFGSVTYTEGLYLLLTTAALRAFDNRNHAWAALWGALATATRATGVTLIPTFLFLAWRERRSASAYAAGLVAGAGLLSFSVYCAIAFGDPIAFLRVQEAWQQPTWLTIFVEALSLKLDSALKVLTVFGMGYVLWRLRNTLSNVAVVYGFWALGLLFFSGVLLSASRIAYGIVSLSLALGVLLACYPRWGYATLGLFAILLAQHAMRFAWWGWVF